MNDSFNVGDIVRYSENGPKLVVESVSSYPEFYRCIWFDDVNRLQINSFIPETLKFVETIRCDEEALHKGEKVKLVWGGPKMIIEVASADGQSYVCSWFDDHHVFHRSDIKRDVLRRLETLRKHRIDDF
ncbi:DUF2158 domain-containing protein [Marinomonas gallaica]|uniref:DUF2158 domain-containing protein n=1 Tax=Marinomonas gallaica TaxID=1806667 RepID=UPI003CE51B55